MGLPFPLGDPPQKYLFLSPHLDSPSPPQRLIELSTHLEVTNYRSDYYGKEMTVTTAVTNYGKEMTVTTAVTNYRGNKLPQ